MLFTAHTITRLAAAGLTLIGLGGPVAPSVTDADPSFESTPQTVEVASTPASRIDPALLNNPTLQRAIATVGPDLVADPAIRDAIRSGTFDRSLLSNPTVTRAMIEVGPMLMADPELSAAVRSGELSVDLLDDPAVLSTLRALDPTLFDEPVIEPVDEPIVTSTMRELPDVDAVEVDEAAEATVAEVADDERRRGHAWGHDRESADHPRNRARGHAHGHDRDATRPQRDRARPDLPEPNERATDAGANRDRERPARRALGTLVRAALDIAAGPRGGPNAR